MSEVLTCGSCSGIFPSAANREGKWIYEDGAAKWNCWRCSQEHLFWRTYGHEDFHLESINANLDSIFRELETLNEKTEDRAKIIKEQEREAYLEKWG